MSTHKDYRKYFALFSIYLIISITFFSANALAAINYRISGEDLVNKWRKAEDVTIFYTNASANVSIETAPNHWESMINCVEHANNSVTCEYILDENILLPTVGDVTWKLREETQPQRIVNATIKVDRLPPKIEKLNITQIGSSLKVVYSIKDYSYPGKIGCSGLDYITYVVGTAVDTIDFNTTVCEYNGTVMFNESGFYQEDFPITISAYDRLGQSVSNTTTMLVDLMGPDIQDEWQIMRGGQVINILSGDTNAPTIKYDVVVYIQDPQLNINRVHADLSGLNINPVIKNTLKNKQASCILETEGMYKCTFSEIPIKPINADINIKVSAYDKSNNFANETLPKTVTILNDAGQVTYIGPLKDHCTSSLSKCYTAPGSQTFIAEIGLGSNFSALIFGFNAETKVGPCFPKEDKWECVYRYNVPDIMQLKVSVSALSTDNYGNRLTYTDRNVIVDSDPPLIIGNITSNLPNCAVASDTLELTVIAKEAASEVLKVHVDTSELTGTDQTNGTCEKTVNDEWLCTLSISGFVTEHPPEMRKVIVEDLAGNKAEKDFKFEVCAEDSNTPPNYITKITPENDIRIDRRTASLLPIKTYIPLTITKSSAATIIEMSVDNCFAIDPDDETSEISVLDSGHYFIDNTLVLYAGFDGAVLPEDEFEINCTVNSRMRAGNKVFLKPEQDSFIIKVTPYNNPLGVLDSSVDTKIADQKAALRDLDKEIELRKTIGGVFETLCLLATTVAKINSLLQTLKAVVYAACLVIAIFSGGLANEIWSWTGGALNYFDINVAQHVWPTNILSGPWYGQAIKYTCMLYTCQHYTAEGLYSITTDAVEGLGILKDKSDVDNFNEDFNGDGFEMEYIDEETISVNGVEYKLESDKDGVETWIGDDGSEIHYIGGRGGWTLIDGPITQAWNNNRYKDSLRTTLGQGHLDPSGNIYYADNGKTYIKGTNGEWKYIDSSNQRYSINKPLGTTNPDGSVTDDSGVKWIKLGTSGGWAAVQSGSGRGLDFNSLGAGQLIGNGAFISQSGQMFQKGEDGKWYSVETATTPVKNIVEEEGKGSGGFYKGEQTTFEYPKGIILLDDTQKNTLKNDYPLISEMTEAVNSGHGKEFFDSMDYNKYTPDSQDYKNAYMKHYAYYTSAAKGSIHALKKNNPSLYYLVTGTKSYNQANWLRQNSMSIINNNNKYIGNTVFLGPTLAFYDITGNVLGITGRLIPEEPEGPGPNFDWGNVDSANEQYINRNAKFYSALENENWIVNPYRSAHWDGLCAPAIVYNLQKEKQIRCKYVNCMETQLDAGMPSYICDRDYGMEACLYIDSAQWHVTGGHFWQTIGPGLLKSAISFVVGMAPYAAYSVGCTNYQWTYGMDKGGVAAAAANTNLATGAPDVLCGVAGALLQWNEINQILSGSYWENMMKGDTPKDPSEINDYCADVNYNE